MAVHLRIDFISCRHISVPSWHYKYVCNKLSRRRETVLKLMLSDKENQGILNRLANILNR